MTFNYNHKRFKVVSNSDQGEVSEDFVFEYHQHGNILTCEYQGGKIQCGQLMGIVDENGKIDMRYQQINQLGQLQTGHCISIPERMENGKIRLHETWQWTSGKRTNGTSTLEEC